MNEKEILIKAEEFVKKTLSDAKGCHDWWHIYRVTNLAKRINKTEKGDPLIVELGALLHDIADHKFHDGDEDLGQKTAVKFLNSLDIPSETVFHIEQIIRNISFKNSFDNSSFKSKELEIIQDADRLDAIGAIGIARAFSYGGHKGNPIYIPGLKPNLIMDKKEYMKGDTTTINHFYEKLLKLKDLMNTETGKAIAEKRHQFMENFLEEIYEEIGEL